MKWKSVPAISVVVALIAFSHSLQKPFVPCCKRGPQFQPGASQSAWVIATRRLPTPVCHLFPGARLFLFSLFPAIPPQRFGSPGSFPYIPSVSLHYFLIKIRENGLKTVLLLLRDSHKSQSTAGGQLLTAVEATSAWKSASFPWFFDVFIENCHSNKSMMKSKIKKYDID